MGLHAITEDSSVLSHHCPNPNCQYHNCQEWEDYLECAHHDDLEYIQVPAEEMRARLKGLIPDNQLEDIQDTIIANKTKAHRVQGMTRQVPIDHPEIFWSAHDLVALPKCECGTQTFLKVNFTEKELRAPNIQIVNRKPS